eukprot:c27743_g1_i1 orf=543-1796(-)
MASEISLSAKSFLGGPILLPPFLSAFSDVTPFSWNTIDWERCSIMELVKWMAALLLFFGVWVTRLIMFCLSNYFGFLEGLSRSASILSNGQDTGKASFGKQFSDNAISRALSQVLDLVNVVPASSDKYEFVRALADLIIQENMSQGGISSMNVNTTVLSESFSRTVKLLTVKLQRLQQQEQLEACRWPLRVIHNIHTRALAMSQQLFSLENLGTRLGNMLLTGPQSESLPVAILPSNATPAGTGIGTDCITAEKLAQELLWISQKLRDCSAVDEAIIQWGAASSLANLSLSAHPRLQNSLLRVCVFMLKELVSQEIKSSTDVKLKLLLLWLPLFCCSKNVCDTPLFTYTEKVEVVSLLEKIIMSLPASNQETVLTSWLQEYSLSSSDWPNLQYCYESWYMSYCKFAFQSYGTSGLVK